MSNEREKLRDGIKNWRRRNPHRKVALEHVGYYTRIFKCQVLLNSVIEKNYKI